MSDAAPSSSSRAILLACVFAALVPFALLAWRFDFVTDDAYITFRYARNLANGAGLVYHAGIAEPVEGYSEFLWALWMALGFEIGVAPETWSRGLSALSGALMVGLVAWLCARRFAGRPVAAVGASAFVGAAPPLAVWATGGMATMPTAALAVALFALTFTRTAGERVVRRGLTVGAVAALLALTRADAALLVALVLGPALAVGVVSRDRTLWRTAAIATAVSAAAFWIHVAWRVSVYDDWLPNTARVKLGFGAKAASRGFDYVVSAFLSMPGLALAFGLALVGAFVARKRIGAAAAASVAALVVGVTAYSISAGGDFMAFARFLVPAIPFAALGLAAALAAIEARSRVAAGAVAAVVVVTTALAAFDVHVVPESVRLKFHFRHNQRFSGVALSTSELQQWRNMDARAKEWGVLGRALARHAPPEASIVYGAVGAIGFFSNLFVYDCNGLVTREVALREPHETLRSPGHDKVVPAEFFRKNEPTFIRAGIWDAATFPPPQLRGRRVQVLGDTEIPGKILWVER